MPSSLAWTTLGVLLLYLAAFAALGRLASRAARRPVWLFGTARGSDLLAALAFRAAFVLAVIGSLAAAAWPGLWLWEVSTPLAVAGHLIAIAGALLAVAAQAAMGMSWRVGVQAGAIGALVTGGLFDLSRNPTFVGQGGGSSPA